MKGVNSGMYRAILFIGMFVAVLCGLGLLLPKDSTYMTFLLPSGGSAIVGLCLSFVLMSFSIFSHFRTRRYKILLGTIGLFLMIVALLGVPWPMYFDALDHVVRASNLFITLVTGTGCLIAGVEYEREGLNMHVLRSGIARRHEQPGADWSSTQKSG